MVSTTAGGGLLASVKQQLAQGRSEEEILAELAASGLSRASAERFLQRARPDVGASAAVVPPPLPAPTADEPPPLPPPASEPFVSAGSWIGVIGGAVVLTLGLAAVAWSLSQPRSVRLRGPLFLVILGGGWMLQAARGAMDARRPATWILPGVAAVPPLVAFLAVLGTLAMTRTRGAERQETAPHAQEAPERRRPSRRTTAPPTREQAISLSVDTLEGRRKGDACVAANTLATSDARDHIGTLQARLAEARETYDLMCIGHALVKLGDTDAMLAKYMEWSQDETDVLRHHGIVGFGHIGPAAATQAMPVLEQAIAAGSTPARRYTVASTLAKLGPSARPLLQTLAADDDPQVRAFAAQALTTLR
jgi:hypothetical protein